MSSSQTSNIYTLDNVKLLEKIEKLKEGGIDSLHVVSDFDRTLTKCFINGKKIPSALALIREGGYLTEDYPKKAFALHAEYSPIETDNSLDYELRSRKMQEWWSRHEKLLVDSGMNRSVIDDIIAKYPKLFRDGALELFDALNEFDIPLLIFSAGVGNIIEGYLKKENKFYGNTFILSNMFNFDENGFAKGYKNKIIHSLNKSTIVIKNHEYQNKIEGRKNVILLGDSIEDTGMVKEVKYKNAMKIGFLNENENLLGQYLQNFDVVITKDGTMDYVNGLLQHIADKD